MPKLGLGSRGHAIVVIQNSTKPFPTFNGAGKIRGVARFSYKSVVESLMIEFEMIMFRVFDDGFPKMVLA